MRVRFPSPAPTEIPRSQPRLYRASLPSARDSAAAGRRSRLGDRFKMPNPSDPEPAGGAEAAREVVACAERTLAAPSARIELREELGFGQADWPRPPGWRGSVLRLAVKRSEERRVGKECRS